jgi:hypothetical protein
MKPTKLLLTLVMVITISMLSLVWFYPPNGDFRAENPFWNGLSTINSKTQLTMISSYDNLTANTKGTALLIVPYEPFSASELTQLDNYVSNGGTLVIFDDYGFGNQILSKVGLNLRFTGEQLLDPLFNYKNKWIPKITDFTSTPIATNVSSIVFNHATSLNDTSGSTIAAYSSKFSFTDLNNDGSWDNNEPNGPFPVIAYTKVGEGYVIAVADPSILINSMIGLDDNLQFIQNVAGLASANPKILIDQSHLPISPLDNAKADLAFVYNFISSPAGTLSLIVVILVLSLHSIWRKGVRLGAKR